MVESFYKRNEIKFESGCNNTSGSLEMIVREIVNSENDCQKNSKSSEGICSKSHGKVEDYL